MKKRSLFIFIFTLMITYSCTNSDSNETIIFLRYLKKIGFSITDNKHLFIVIPNNGCGGCVSTYVDIIEQNQILFERKNITIISTRQEFQESPISRFSNYIYDKNNELDYINLDLYNVCIIQTNDEKVIGIKRFDVNEVYMFRSIFENVKESK